jgi:Gas vesicle synthesis protein GvpL/GvpF
VIPGLYVYAIGRAGHPPVPDVEQLVEGPLAAFFARVDLRDYSQQAIDAHAKDVEWLGAIGYRHQEVMTKLMHGGTILPLRAFTLFGGDEALRSKLRDDAERYTKVLERLDGKQEWTLRIELAPEAWSAALTRRVEPLRVLSEEIAAASAGKAFLLRKKLDEAKKQASRDAEQALVAEIEAAVMAKLACDTVAESRQQRDGAFPQLNVLLNRDEEARLQELVDDLSARYDADGVTFAVTGPWPPYTFANADL